MDRSISLAVLILSPWFYLLQLDMASSSQVYPLAAYLNSSTPIAGPSKARSSYIPSARTVVGVLVGKPLWWALSAVGIGGSSDEAESDVKEWKRAKGKWVVWDNLQVSSSVQTTSSASGLANHASSFISPPAGNK